MTAPTCRRHPDVEMVVVEEGTLNGVEVRYYGCPALAVDPSRCRRHTPCGRAASSRSAPSAYIVSVPEPPLVARGVGSRR